MGTPHDSLSRTRMIVLDEGEPWPDDLFEPGRIPGFRKMATLVGQEYAAVDAEPPETWSSPYPRELTR